MTKTSPKYNPYKAENPFLAMSVIGLQTTSVMTEMWLGAVRGMMDASKETEKQPEMNPVASASAEASAEPLAEQNDDLKKITGVGPKLRSIAKRTGRFCRATSCTT